MRSVLSDAKDTQRVNTGGVVSTTRMTTTTHTIAIVILAPTRDRLAPLGSSLELDVPDVDPGIDDVDVHPGVLFQGGGRVVVPHQGGQGQLGSMRDSRETPRGGSLVRDVVPIRGRGRQQRRRRRRGDGLEDASTGTRDLGGVVERLGTEIERDDLIVLDVLYLGTSADQVEGVPGEGSGVPVEPVLGVRGGLEDLGDPLEGGRGE